MSTPEAEAAVDHTCLGGRRAVLLVGEGGAGTAMSSGLLMVWCLVANTHGEGGDLGPWSLSKAMAPSCVQATLGLRYGFPGAGWKQKSRSEPSSG